MPGCQGCDLYKGATQAVFGEGAARSRIVLVGEQPGDREDLEGRPFVGPAGRLLDRGLREAGIARREAYVTNAVKHFKYVRRGKRRIHEKPDSVELAACRPWLEAELEVIRPRVLVALGAMAARSLFGSGLRVTKERGKTFPSKWCERSLATVHPSAILRAIDDAERHRAYEQFVADLHAAARALRATSG